MDIRSHPDPKPKPKERNKRKDLKQLNLERLTGKKSCELENFSISAGPPSNSRPHHPHPPDRGQHLSTPGLAPNNNSYLSWVIIVKLDGM